MLEAPRRWGEQTSPSWEAVPQSIRFRPSGSRTGNSRRHPRSGRGERSRRSATSTRASPCCTHRPNTPRAHVLVMGDDLSNLGACLPATPRSRARRRGDSGSRSASRAASFPRPQRAKGGIAPASTRLPGGKGRGSGPDQRRARCRRRAFRECPDRARAPRACRVRPLAPFAGARVAVLTFWGGGGTAESSDRGPSSRPPRPIAPSAPETDPPSSPPTCPRRT